MPGPRGARRRISSEAATRPWVLAAWRARGTGAGRDTGMVTVETAILLPALAALLAGLLWVIAAVVGQVRCIDAAREAARLAARGDPAGSVTAVARRIAPPGAGVTISRRDGQVVATVTARQGALGGWADRLGGMALKAEATATDETGPLGATPAGAP